MDQEMHNLYICDPLKNKDCSGNGYPHCGKQCFCTTNPEMALVSAIALSEEQYREEERKRNGKY